MEDMLELEDILQTLVELFMLPSVRLKLILDSFMEDLAFRILPPMLASLVLLLPLSLGSMEDTLEQDDMWQTLEELFMLPSVKLKLMPDFSMEDMVMDMASQILPPMLASMDLLLPLSLVSMEDTPEPDDMLQTLEELFMLPSVKLKLMPDFSMEDMVMDMASQILAPMLALLDLFLPLSL